MTKKPSSKRENKTDKINDSGELAKQKTLISTEETQKLSKEFKPILKRKPTRKS